MKTEEVDNLLANPPKDAVPPLQFFHGLEFASNVRMCDANGRYWFIYESEDEAEWREGNSGVTPETWLLLPDQWKEVYPPEEVHAEGCDGKFDCGLGCACECHPLEEAKEGFVEVVHEFSDKDADDLAFKTGYTAGAEAAEARFRGKIGTLEKALDIAAKNYDNAEAQLQDLTHSKQTLSDSYDVLMDELEVSRAQRDAAEAALAQTHEFEVAGKLHKVHHSDLVSVLQQMMEMVEANHQAADTYSRQSAELARQASAAATENGRLRNQLAAIRKMSKVV